MSAALSALGLERAAAAPREASLPEAVREFEAYFVGEMLRSATRTPLGEGGLDGGPQARMYRELFYQEIARLATAQGGLGLGALIAPQAPGEAAAEPPAPAAAPEREER